MEKHIFGGLHDSSVNWLSLPHDILSIISNKVTDPKDYIRFGAVCRAWRTRYNENGNHILRERLLLMLPTACEKNPSLYSLYETKIYSNLTRPLPQNMYCRGSSHGWLAMVSYHTHQVCLVNPFLSVNNQIPLPPLTAFDRVNDPLFEGIFLKKVVLSDDPISNPNYSVMAIHGQYKRVSYFKAGDEAWTPLAVRPIDDIIYDDNKFLILHNKGRVLACDVNGSCPTDELEVAPQVESKHFGDIHYLVKSSNELLRVIRDKLFYGDSELSSDEEEDSEEENLEGDPNEEEEEEEGDPSKCTDYYYTTKFRVLKLDEEGQWKEKESLDGRVIFVGDNSSLSLSITDMPGCKPNCIYFTDDYHEAYLNVDGVEAHDIGFFNMEDKSITYGHPIEGRMFVSPPVLIQPTLN